MKLKDQLIENVAAFIYHANGDWCDSFTTAVRVLSTKNAFANLDGLVFVHEDNNQVVSGDPDPSQVSQTSEKKTYLQAAKSAMKHSLIPDINHDRSHVAC